jgi:hypothetical protein
MMGAGFPSIEEIFKKLDANGDGSVTLEEFRKAHEEMRRRWSAAAEKKPDDKKSDDKKGDKKAGEKKSDDKKKSEDKKPAEKKDSPKGSVDATGAPEIERQVEVSSEPVQLAQSTALPDSD